MRLPAYCKVIVCYIKTSIRNNGYFILLQSQERKPGRYLCHLSAMGTGNGLERGGSSLISTVANTNVKDHVNNTSLKDFSKVVI